ncbi:MAG TPA: hypothetical protein VGP24_02915 [Glaciihabitans sp.]|jgi:hypothetical protein|nr:hypothetical protein [Glaciihabitans sp.]HEV7948697.1 hypothetical protein [Glaciihabitans sp.]
MTNASNSETADANEPITSDTDNTENIADGSGNDADEGKTEGDTTSGGAPEDPEK